MNFRFFHLTAFEIEITGKHLKQMSETLVLEAIKRWRICHFSVTNMSVILCI
ncbi:hypothetical protein [Methanobrevibacter sp.]|uniref:hypothetical protein n=1 Tax=Methanobrevibacter sp. TaxID=66852 RepID=UPI00386F272A